jgi:hypothetical protein
MIGMRLCPEVLGTHDGLAAAAYVRESRRIAAEFTVLETHVGVEARPGASRAEAFPDYRRCRLLPNRPTSQHRRTRIP